MEASREVHHPAEEEDITVAVATATDEALNSEVCQLRRLIGHVTYFSPSVDAMNYTAIPWFSLL